MKTIILTVLNLTRSSLFTKEMFDDRFKDGVIFKGVSVEPVSKSIPDPIVNLTLSGDLDNCLSSIRKSNFIKEWQRSIMFSKLTERETKAFAN